jgi:4-hydroxybenzoate polyprenyltransferase
MNFISKEKLSAYIRLSRLNNLFGAYLLLLPSYWSLALNDYNENLYLLIKFYAIFFFGAIIMRSFGCVINDMADRNIDKQVTRTVDRPLASGILRHSDALKLLFILGLLGLLILYLLYMVRPNTFAVIVALCSLIFVFIYPFCKRFFSAPQLVLGITFNWGILLADALLNFSISSTTIILYLASIIWTIAYDTIYAYQDYECDKKIGVKSTAVLIGDNPRKILKIMYIVFILVILGIGNIEGYGYLFYLIVIVSSIILLKLLKDLDYKDAKLCLKFFKHNVYFATSIWVAFLLY